MFELRIAVKSIEEAERILACLAHDAEEVQTPGQISQRVETVQETSDEPVEDPTWLRKAKEALMGVQAKYGAADMAKPLAILGQFGAGRISELKEHDGRAFIAACLAA